MTQASLGLALVALPCLFAAFWWRPCFGGLLRKWQAQVLCPVLSVPFGLAWLGGEVAWWQALVAALALQLQWFWPGRDFAKAGSLAVAHGVWAAVMVVAGFPAAVGGPFVVVGAYALCLRYGDHGAVFWKPTVLAEALSGLGVFGFAYLGLVLHSANAPLWLAGAWWP